MRKYLLPESGNFYKANLHCHTTVSDGTQTPMEIKEAYSEQGYSVVAYTDHNVLIAHPELNDDKFLALNGVEINVNAPSEVKNRAKTCHLCLIALDENNLVQPCWHREKYLNPANTAKYRDQVRFDQTKPDWERVYDPEHINAIIKEARKKGFYVTYNHPTWSLEFYEDYINYDGMHAMEIVNYSSLVLGYDEYNSKAYDDMLRKGKRIYAVCADDNHSKRDRFGGFTMIKAEKLEYSAITDALIKGNTYSSEGPIINDLWFEDGKVHIGFEPAQRAYIVKPVRSAGNVNATDGQLITEAEFNVDVGDIYFRIVVVGTDGRCAYTNAYFTDDLF